MTGKLFDLSDRVAIVTGSGRGLGKVIAIGLADAGAAVTVCARNVEEPEQTAQEIRAAGGAAIAKRTDTSDRESCRSLVETTVEEFGRLDILVNNAGIVPYEPAVDVTEEHWDQVLDINLKGYFNCSQFAAQRMMSQGDGGSIVNISSIAGSVGIAGLMAYGATKGGINQITRVMALEWAEHGIRVNAIGPGYFDTAMRSAGVEHAREEKEEHVTTFTPMRRRGRPEELIGPVVFLASDAASYVTGAILMIDGGYTAI